MTRQPKLDYSREELEALYVALKNYERTRLDEAFEAYREAESNFQLSRAVLDSVLEACEKAADTAEQLLDVYLDELEAQGYSADDRCGECEAECHECHSDGTQADGTQDAARNDETSVAEVNDCLGSDPLPVGFFEFLGFTIGSR